MSVLKLTKEIYENEVLKSDKPVLIDFYATWCGPCRMVSPIVDEIAAEHPEYLVCKVNVDEEAELSKQFGIMSIPALFVLKDGEIVDSVVGYRPKEAILELLK